MNYQDAIDRSLDGRLSPEEWEDLQAAVVRDSALRRDYVERRWIHALLETEGARFFAPEAPAAVTQSPYSVWRRASWIAAAAAVALFGASLALHLRSGAPPVVATLIEAENCRWAGSDLPTMQGAGLGAGTLALTEGMATIRFKSGATVTLEAPSVLEVESEMKCRLLEGSVVAEVPESAHGFTIDTAQMEVIDLGTRFGVTATPLGHSNVFVFEGEVKVNRDDLAEAKHVFAGNSLVSRVGAAPAQSVQEVRRVEATPPLPGPGWVPVTTAAGRGRDAYMRRGDSHGPTGGQALLMVKDTDLAATNQRRALLAFDLAGLERSTLRAAKLTLKVEPSGLGFSSLVPDSRFAVYGIVDPILAASWSESEILWKNAGSLAADSIGPETAIRLAEFEIRKGSPNGLVEAGSEALADFLRTQPGEIVSFLLIRETGESDPQGLVHAFASKEHPIAPAPTLWLQTAP